MYEIVKDFPNEIIYKEAEPCVSLYQTTHRHGPENKKDRIVFKHLVQQIEESLEHMYEKSDIKQIMDPFYRLKDDTDFWMHTLDGLAILACKDECIVYLLNSTVEELVFVSKSFHIKPLIRYFQATNTYCLLGLGSNSISFFEGNRYGVKEIEIGEEIDKEIAELIHEEHPDGFVTHGRYGGAEGVGMFHGRGGRKDAIDKDLEKFFRYVDKTVMEKFSKPTNAPLILVSLEEHQSAFRKISNNPYLLQEGISLSYESLDLDQLAKKALDIMESLFMRKTQGLVERYNNARANALGSDVLLDVSRAALEGRVETILVEADRNIPARLDAGLGELEFGSIDNPESGDLIDHLVIAVLKNKGEAVVLPLEEMPTNSGLAAIFRF